MDYEQQMEQTEILKRSLTIWTDVRSYDPIIESICIRTLERYEIDAGFRSLIEETINRDRSQAKSDRDHLVNIDPSHISLSVH